MKKKKEKYIYLDDGSVLVRETMTIWGDKVGYYRLIRNSDISIADCNKNIEPNMKDNHKALRLSKQQSNEDIIRD